MATITVRNVGNEPVLIGECYLFPTEMRTAPAAEVNLDDDRLLWVRPVETPAADAAIAARPRRQVAK